MYEFTPNDIAQIQNHGLSLDVVQGQLADFATGFPYSDIVRPAVIGDGVRKMLGDEYGAYYDAHCDEYKIVKFVPASGAATRMFKDLFEFLSSGQMNKTTQMVLDNLEKFAFWDDLKLVLPENPTAHDVVECLITERGLNYGAMPKALLQFHKYADANRTALAEHLVEGAQYATTNGIVNIHFTVSPEHIAGFDDLLAKILPEFESVFGVKYDVSKSVQKSSTDTIAVNLDNTPFRNDDGSLLFRPAGHGALIENLNDIEGDLIFVKNIDNVCPDDARDSTIVQKKRLAGLAMKLQARIFEYMRALDMGTANTNEIVDFINDNLGIVVDAGADLRAVLNRPLRVCGIIKNTGEPGGGPFWVRDADGTLSLQIVEPGQIAPENIAVLKNGEFFNPVDLVCMPRDYMGNKFDLTKYVDTTAGFISEKSKNGRVLRAMERPGLWNGAMAKWNTVFVETTLDTFTPVKVVSDLLGAGHTVNK